MAETAPALYVARPSDLEALNQRWSAAKAGKRSTVLLTSPLGGGKRALVGELGRKIHADGEDALVWRVSMTDEEDGLRSLIRMYAALFGAIHRDPVFRGRIEMALNAQLPNEPKRVQQWFQAFVDGLKKGGPKPGEQQIQVTLPRDNPLIGLVEIVHALSRRFPILLDLQNLHLCHSLTVFAFLEALHDECRDGKLLVVMHTETLDEAAKGWVALPFLDFLERRTDDIAVRPMERWDVADVEKYLQSKGLQGDAARLHAITGGLPGYVAEVADLLQEKGALANPPADLSLANLCDVAPDEDELEAPEGEPAEGQRKHAVAADAERVAFLAALLGVSFPSGLVADMGGYDRDSIDDLMDATEQTYKELQFSQPLGTWIYQFKKGVLRESVLLRHRTDEDKAVARNVGAFMERFLVPRGYEFLVKTMRLYAENGELRRAAMLRSMALASDQPQTWAMAQDLVAYFDEITWPDPLRRTVFMNLLDRMVNTGDVNQTEALYGQAKAWAEAKADKPMLAWLQFAGSRLDFRRQDLYRARDRAVEALKLYAELDDKLKSAEIHNHLAMIELQDGNPQAALEQSNKAQALADIPPIKAHGHYVQGLVHKRDRKFNEAADEFRRSNELAGESGQAPLALEAGLNYGEALLMSGQTTKAADVLGRVVRIAQQLQNPVRDRAASALLGQAHAALNNFEAALQSAQRTLQLTQQLGFNRFVAVDTYNVGFFTLMLGRHTEGATLLKQAKAAATGSDPSFLKELNFNLGAALIQIGEKEAAKGTLEEAVAQSTAAQDWRKVMAGSEHLANLAVERGDRQGAKGWLEKALDASDKGNLREERKKLRRKMDELGA